MNENLYGMFDNVLQSEYSIIEEGSKKTIELGKDAKYGKMETYSLFDGIIIAFMNINMIILIMYFLKINFLLGCFKSITALKADTHMQ